MQCGKALVAGGAALCSLAALMLILSRPDELIGKYDFSWNGAHGGNDMIDKSMGRIISYSDGDRDTRERPFMAAKFRRLQSIIDSIHNGPAGNSVPLPPPKPQRRKGTTSKTRKIHPHTQDAPGSTTKPKVSLSYMQRIIEAIERIQLRVNAAGKRQYMLEDLAATAKKQVGKNGPQGPTGFPGRSGKPGALGDRGKPGDDGTPGKHGEDSSVVGAPGAKGVPGPQGIDGFDGTPDFVAGPRGPMGTPGEQGTTGLSGKPGLDGCDGVDGNPGRGGPPGSAGAEGKPGKNGEDGLPGPKGAVGARGEFGKPGFSGSQGRASEDVGTHGPPGDDGPPGKRGPPGMTGQTGLRGPLGVTGPTGLQGNNGQDGAMGRPGIASGGVRVFGGSIMAEDELCHFPFLHEGKTYTRCTSRGLNQPWCYVDANRERWGYCDIKVPVLQGDSIPGDTCYFPYVYEGKEYTQCTVWESSPPPGGGKQAHTGVTWCFTNTEKTRYGICQQEVAGGTSEKGDVCGTPCRTDYSTRPWCYSAPDKSRWGMCLFKELRVDGSFVWV